MSPATGDARGNRRQVDVRIATYNIHRCRGMDRRVDPARIVEVLRDINADVIALQEVIGAGPTGSGQAEEIGAALGMGWVMNSCATCASTSSATSILSRYPIVHHSQYDLSWRTCESRNASAPTWTCDGRIVHIYNVHLGTAVLERRYQAPRLAAFVHDHRVRGPKIILGDFNEWMRGLATQTLSALFKSVDIHEHLRRRRTYPGLLPGGPPRPHLLRGAGGRAKRRAPANAQGADRLGSSAARRQPPSVVRALTEFC